MDELQAVVDLHAGNIRKYLAFAEADGLADRDDYSVWTVTPEGRRWLDSNVALSGEKSPAPSQGCGISHRRGDGSWILATILFGLSEDFWRKLSD